MPGMNQLSQQRTTSVLRVLEAFIKNVERMHDRVQSYQIGSLQRTHRVSEALSENHVDLLRRGDVVLQDKGGLVHEQVGYPVGNKARHVLDNDGHLLQLGEQLQQRADCQIGGVESPDHLDGWLQMDRIHEVNPDHIGGTPGGAAYLSHGNARGIGSKADLGRRQLPQFLVERPFDSPILGNVLDDEVAGSQVLQISGQGHALQSLIPACRRQRLAEQRSEPYVVQHLGLSAFEDVFCKVHNNRWDPMKDQVGDDRNPDVVGAQNAYSSQVH